MTAFKQFLSSDLIVTPFEVNKGFSFVGAAALTGSDVGIDRFLGKNIDGLFNTSQALTGEVTSEYQSLVYNSIKQLYYSNYLSSSFGDEPSVPYVVPGLDSSGDVLLGSGNSAGRYENYLQTTLRTQHYYPTASNAIVGVVSVPSKLFGEYIQPGSFRITGESGSVYDDQNGGLYSGSTYVGNIIYQHGISIFTTGAVDLIENLVTSPNINCSFSSSYTIFETQYKCTINSNEYSFTLNPTVISGSTDGTVYDYVTGSYFNPYVTTVGLYNENQDLIAVGKLSQPLPLNSVTDTNILINIDR